MVVLDQRTDVDAHRSTRTRWAVAAAAVALVVVAGVLVLWVAGDSSSDDPVSPSPQTTPSTTAPTAAGSTAEETALAWIEARDASDADRALALLAPGVEELQLDRPDSVVPYAVDVIPEVLGAWEVFGLASQDVACAESDAPEASGDVAPDAVVVTCRYLIRNRLTEYTGVDPYAGTTELTIGPDGIVAATRTYDLSKFSSGAFEPFFFWTAATHPDELVVAWDFFSTGPVLSAATPEGNAAFARHLDEYTAGDTPPIPSYERFLEARAGATADDPGDLLAPEAEVSDLWMTAPDEYAGAAELFRAVGWTWETIQCGLFDPNAGPDTVVLGCQIDSDNPFADPDPADAVFTITPEGITRVQVGISYPGAFEAWHDWLRAEHPDDVAMLYGTSGDEWIPETTPDALELLATRGEEFGESQSR